jgi:hypothetical protein
MSLSADALGYLTSPGAAALLTMDLPAEPLAAQTLLRKQCEPDQAAAVATLRELRSRAGRKFPSEMAAGLLATDKSLQQASSWPIAQVKARRFAAAGVEAVWDLCCGLGADGLAVAAAGLAVQAADCDEAMVVCANHNARLAGLGERFEARRGDVTQLALPAGAVVHIDPDRRAGPGRAVALESYRPDAAFLRGLIKRTAGGCMKLSPATDWAVLSDWPGVAVEVVSQGRVARQLLAWWGVLAGEGLPRRATVVGGTMAEPTAESIEAGRADAAAVRPVGPWLIEPDPAVIAARGVDDLAAAHQLWRLGEGLNWLSGDGPVETSLARSYEVLGESAGRVKDVARLVAELDGGAVTVKPAGLRLDTDRLARQLGGSGGRALGLFWGRFGRSQRVFVTAWPARGGM